jgi:uncharacterized membrane protein
MSARWSHGICLVLLLANFVLAAYLYPQLPDPVPSHWNASGQADGFTPKPWGVFLLPLVSTAAYLLLTILPAISPRGFRMDEFADVVRLFQLAVLVFFSLITMSSLMAARGDDVDLGRIILSGLGLLFMVIGGVMGRLRKNFFIGIRTPWTLASELVWNRTHRLAAWCFGLAGAVVTLGALLDAHFAVTPISIAAAVLIPVVYSFLLYRRLEGFGPDADRPPGK